MYQLLGTLDWILVVDCDFFRIFFQLQKLRKILLVLIPVALLPSSGKFSMLLDGFFNADEFQQAGD